MPAVLGQDPSGAWLVQLDDGRQIRTATDPATLGLTTAPVDPPPAPAPTPEPAPTPAPPPAAPAPGPSSSSAPSGMPRIVGERGGGATDGAGTRYYTVEDPGGGTREVRATSLGSGIPRQALRDWAGRKAEQERQAAENARRNNPGTMTKEERQDWEAGLSPQERSRYLLGGGGRQASDEADRLRKELGMPDATLSDLRDLMANAGPSSSSAPRPKATQGLTAEDAALPVRASSAPGAPPVPSAAPPGAGGPGGTPTAPSFRAAAPPSGERELRNAYGKVQAAAGERAALEEVRAQGEAARLDAEADAMRVQEAARLEREAKNEQEAQGAEDKLRQVMADADKEVGSVDPGRWWKSRSTGQKILATLSAFFTGVGGGHSPVRDAIQADIAAQEGDLTRRIQQRQLAVGNQMKLMDVMYQRFGDVRLARTAAEAFATNLAKKQADQAAAKYGGQEAGVRAKELSAQLGVEVTAKVQALRQQSVEWAFRREQLDIQRKGAEAELAAARAKAAGPGQVAPNADPATLTPEQRKLFVPGVGLALSDQSAEKARALKIGYAQAAGSLQEMIKLREEYGAETLNRDAVRRGKALRSRALLAIKNLEETGALDKGTVEVTDPMIPADPLEWSVGTAESMRTALEGFNQKYDSAMLSFTGRKVGVPSMAAHVEAQD